MLGRLDAYTQVKCAACIVMIEGGEFLNEIRLGDLVQMRKTHPCGSDRWTVIRVGADIKIKCEKCARIVMMDRADFIKRMKKLIERKQTEETSGDE